MINECIISLDETILLIEVASSPILLLRGYSYRCATSKHGTAFGLIHQNSTNTASAVTFAHCQQADARLATLDAHTLICGIGY